MKEQMLLHCGSVTREDIRESNPILIAGTINTLRAELRYFRGAMTEILVIDPDGDKRADDYGRSFRIAQRMLKRRQL
jgi:hypothetical protein